MSALWCVHLGEIQLYYYICTTILCLGDIEFKLGNEKDSYTDVLSGLDMTKIPNDNLQNSDGGFESPLIGPDCLNQPDLCHDGFTVEFQTKGLISLHF